MPNPWPRAPGKAQNSGRPSRAPIGMGPSLPRPRLLPHPRSTGTTKRKKNGCWETPPVGTRRGSPRTRSRGPRCRKLLSRFEERHPTEHERPRQLPAYDGDVKSDAPAPNPRSTHRADSGNLGKFHQTLSLKRVQPVNPLAPSSHRFFFPESAILGGRTKRSFRLKRSSMTQPQRNRSLSHRCACGVIRGKAAIERFEVS